MTFAMPAMHPSGRCNVNIVGVFVRVSCPTETDRLRQTDRPRQTDQHKQTHTLRAGGFEREAL